MLTAPPAPRVARVVGLEATPLTVPLRVPFIIATARMDSTRAVLVKVTLEDESGRRAIGLGEAAALPPVTHEDQPDLLRSIGAARDKLVGAALADLAAGETLAATSLPGGAVARAGVAGALADAWTRLAGVPLYVGLRGGLVGAAPAPVLETDVTLPIGDADHVAALAATYRADGFSCFKVKVGRDLVADHRALRAVARAVPDARFRLDANAGFTAREALELLDRVTGDELPLECFEQPCAREDLAGMAEVTARSAVPVVADESFRGADDLERLVAARAASAVNLKLAKLGGPSAAVALGHAARAQGLRLMAGAMVETRVGIATMAHVVAALGGVDWVDLDTAFLLARDPFVGGYVASGARIALDGRAGTGVALATSS